MKKTVWLCIMLGLLSMLIIGCSEKVTEKPAPVHSVTLPDSVLCCNEVSFRIHYGLTDGCYAFSGLHKTESNKTIHYTLTIKKDEKEGYECPQVYRRDSMSTSYVFEKRGTYVFHFNDSSVYKEVVVY